MYSSTVVYDSHSVVPVVVLLVRPEAPPPYSPIYTARLFHRPRICSLNSRLYGYKRRIQQPSIVDALVGLIRINGETMWFRVSCAVIGLNTETVCDQLTVVIDRKVGLVVELNGEHTSCAVGGSRCSGRKAGGSGSVLDKSSNSRPSHYERQMPRSLTGISTHSQLQPYPSNQPKNRLAAAEEYSTQGKPTKVAEPKTRLQQHERQAQQGSRTTQESGWNHF